MITRLLIFRVSEKRLSVFGRWNFYSTAALWKMFGIYWGSYDPIIKVPWKIESLKRKVALFDISLPTAVINTKRMPQASLMSTPKTCGGSLLNLWSVPNVITIFHPWSGVHFRKEPSEENLPFGWNLRISVAFQFGRVRPVTWEPSTSYHQRYLFRLPPHLVWKVASRYKWISDPISLKAKFASSKNSTIRA